MSDVFVSYKAEDRRRVKPLVDALERDGFSVWWDEQIGGGASWRQSIEAELNAARCVLVVWSKRSVGPEGTFVQDEATRAQQRRVYVPVLIDKVHLPLGFGETQALSLTGWRGNRQDPRFEAVIAAVRRTIGSADSGAPARADHAQVSRRAVLGGGALATAAIAGFGGWMFLKPSAAAASASIAVLPFANLSGDPEQDYFAAGIAGEIRNSLTRISGLKVAGSTSSEAVRQDDAETAARKLGVANILTGNVRQTPATIRVTAELIDGDTGLAKWSQNYDRDHGDVIKIQTDIAQNVARALAIALSAGARKALATAGTSNVAAQQLVFQARDSSWQLTVPALRHSVELLDRAIALDPNYARAYAMKSFVVNNLVELTARTGAELARGRQRAFGFAKTALSLGPDLPLAHSALGFAYLLNLQVADAVREQTIALSLASGDPDVIRNYGLTISSAGKPQKGLRYVDEALGLDPLNWASHRSHVDVLFDARRYKDAVRYSLELKQKTPELFKFPALLGDSLLMLGRTKDAAAAFAQVGDENDRSLGEALLAARTGDRGGGVAKLSALQQRAGEMANYSYAQIYAQLGDKDAAFGALDRAWEIRDSGLSGLKTNPYLDLLRDDPRYDAMVDKLDYPFS